MLIAVPDSHRIGGDIPDSALFAPQQSSSLNPQSVSLFDLLLSQLFTSSLQANPNTSENPPVSSELTNHQRASVGPIAHPTKQKPVSAANQAAVNPLTNLLFVSNGQLQRPGMNAASSALGISSYSRNVASTPADADVKQPASITMTSPGNGSKSVGTQGTRSAGKSAAISDGPEFEAAQPSADSKANGASTSTKAQNDPDLRAFSLISDETSPKLVTTEPVSLSQNRFEPTLVVPDLSRSNVVMETKSARATFEPGALAPLDGFGLEAWAASATQNRVISTIQRPNPQKDDSVVSMDPTTAPVNTFVEPQVSREPVAPISEHLTAAVTENLANAPHEGPTSVRIRLDRPDLGTIHLQLSVTKNVVSIRIMTDNQRSQQIVESQISGLRQSLTSSGVECGQFQVGSDSNNRQFSIQKSPGQPARSMEVFASSRGSGPATLKFPVTRPNGSVNFVA